MPKTKLTEKYCKPKMPKRNYLAEEMRYYKKSAGLTDEEIADRMDVCQSAVTRNFNKPAMEWRLKDLQKYCEIIGMPFANALETLKKC